MIEGDFRNEIFSDPSSAYGYILNIYIYIYIIAIRHIEDNQGNLVL